LCLKKSVKPTSYKCAYSSSPMMMLDWSHLFWQQNLMCPESEKFRQHTQSPFSHMPIKSIKLRCIWPHVLPHYSNKFIIMTLKRSHFHLINKKPTTLLFPAVKKSTYSNCEKKEWEIHFFIQKLWNILSLLALNPHTHATI